MKITDENVVEQLKVKNEKALFYIVDEYGGTIKSIIRKYLGNLEIVQDECLDDVLLLVWKNIESYDENKNSLKNWIAAITKYKSIDYQRQYKRFLQQYELEDHMLEDFNRIETKIVENTLSDQTEKLLSSLNKEDQRLFLQYYGEQKSIEELAKEHGVHTSVLYNRLSRGRKKLRAVFKNKLNEKEESS
ncbi:sigma-70 family RNA polymerase sigma factor [Cytobacillus praedii]|uniref:sigma-70 family RNA polymerase sigma factor n=1 Tax=Cytobacillus praedii TaxID=1742358 RepID=UPI002E1AE128|nr:sigma-70 family RNA polymerase sigma factor [Cytobacillus praedii]